MTGIQRMLLTTKLSKYDNLEDLIKAASEDLDLKTVVLNPMKRILLINELLSTGVQLKKK